MGDLTVIDPAAETLHFVGHAKGKVARLLKAMLHAKDLIVEARTDQEFQAFHDDLLGLQEALADANALLEFLAEVSETAHRERKLLREMLPNGQEILLLAVNDATDRAALMQVTRQFARIECHNILVGRVPAGLKLIG